MLGLTIIISIFIINLHRVHFRNLHGAVYKLVVLVIFEKIDVAL